MDVFSLKKYEGETKAQVGGFCVPRVRTQTLQQFVNALFLLSRWGLCAANGRGKTGRRDDADEVIGMSYSK